MIGQTLSHFKITAKLGEGGMGEVYRAEDSKLGREVAIKVLPEAFGADAERLARFEREARLLAALDHPNIAAIYEVGEHEGRHFLAMQLAEGEDLAQRIGRGAIPLAEALPIALQITAALEAAHDRGIVHRDLKPANVMLDDKGQVTVLDFGLAKAFDSPGGMAGDGAMTHSPTLTAQMTVAGVILGTAAYMSPEQAKGEEADKRSDIWAFGVLLAEALTGQRVFDEPTLSETLASVLKSAPDLGQLPASVPRPIHRLLDRCLRKDPRERLHDIADARLVLEDVAEGRIDEEPEGTVQRRPAMWIGLVAAGILLGVAGMALLGGRENTSISELPPRHFVIEHGDMSEARPQLSPGGHRVAYSKEGQIWVRDLRRLEAIPVPGTEGAFVPFWSPDGQWLGFSTQQEGLLKIHLDGSGKTMLANLGAGPTAGGAVWLPDGRIVFTTGTSEILEVSDRGGDTKVLSPLLEGEDDFHFLTALPDAKGLLTTVHRGDIFDAIELMTPDGERREILKLPGYVVGQAAYSPTGHLIFSRYPGGLWAASFSIDDLTVTGEPFPLAPDGDTVSVGRDATLAYSMVLPPVESEMVILNRSGQVRARIGQPTRGLLPSPALSPNGRTVVAPVMGSRGWDLWSFDVAGAPQRRLTFGEQSWNTSPAWSADGTELYYTVSRSSDDYKMMRMSADGGGPGAEVIASTWPPAFTSDGKTMVYNARSTGFNWNLWMRGVDEEGPGTPLLTAAGWEIYPALSPDNRFLAYSLDGQVLVRGFPGMEGPWEVGPGEVPIWGPSDDRLYYLNGADMMEIRFQADPELRFESPQKLFSFVSSPSEQGGPRFALTPDGEGFIVVRPLEPPPGIIVLQNWLGTLE